MPDFYYQPPKPDNNSKKIVWQIIIIQGVVQAVTT